MSPAVEVTTQLRNWSDDTFSADLVAQIPTLRRSALWFTRQEADAEDLVQDTVARAWERRAQFRPGTNLRAWLATIQRSIFINGYRRQRPVAWLGSLEEEEESGRTAAAMITSSAEETMLENWVDEDLHQALAALPEPFRQVVVLRDVAQRSYAQIAADLACPQGTVMSRLHRGRALLRQMLEQGRPEAHTHQVRGVAAQQRSAGARAVPQYTAQAA